MSDPAILFLVRFKSKLSLDEVIEIAERRADEFRALTGLTQKYYLHDQSTGEVGGCYLWASPDDLEEYKKSELRATITEAYQIEGEPKIDVFRILMPLR
jgi:hypothetical protein